MENVLALLILVSIACIFIGRKKPELFKKVLGSRATKSGATMMFGISAGVFFVLFGIVSDHNKPLENPAINQPATVTQAPATELPVENVAVSKSSTITQSPVAKAPQNKDATVAQSAPSTQVSPAVTPVPQKSAANDPNSIIESHCSLAWPNDNNMKSYCEKQQNDGLAALNKSKPSYVTDSDNAIIISKCTSEWSTDFNMQAYCRKQQYDGVSALNQNKLSYVTDSDNTIIVAKCASDWSTDFNMQAYCRKQQYDAILRLNQSNPDPAKRADCAGQWPNDFNMREYCEKQN